MQILEMSGSSRSYYELLCCNIGFLSGYYVVFWLLLYSIHLADRAMAMNFYTMFLINDYLSVINIEFWWLQIFILDMGRSLLIELWTASTLLMNYLVLGKREMLICVY